MVEPTGLEPALNFRSQLAKLVITIDPRPHKSKIVCGISDHDSKKLELAAAVVLIDGLEPSAFCVSHRRTNHCAISV